VVLLCVSSTYRCERIRFSSAAIAAVPLGAAADDTTTFNGDKMITILWIYSTDVIKLAQVFFTAGDRCFV
jgi:hypothetical protein